MKLPTIYIHVIIIDMLSKVSRQHVWRDISFWVGNVVPLPVTESVGDSWCQRVCYGISVDREIYEMV